MITPDRDPGYVELEFNEEDWTDPTKMEISGRTVHGGMIFSAPYVSLIDDASDGYHALYLGGCDRRLVLPRYIDNVVSLYVWEKYRIHPDHDVDRREFTMYDAEGEVNRDEVIEIANLVNTMRKNGNTLVHCQAGLNRSSLVSAVSLLLLGRYTPEGVIQTLRERRSQACLCNKSFEEFVRNFDAN